MVKHSILLLAIASVMTFSACHEEPTYDNTLTGNFDALWNIVDQRYCFFEEKGIDWKEVGQRYRQKIVPGTNAYELFDICADMLAELHDGHVNLASSFNISYYREWWTAYPQDFSLRTVQEYYLDFDYATTSGIIYKVLPGNIGYMYYPSFSYLVGEGSLDYILASMAECRGLIIDIRDNGGGALSNIKTLVGRFIDKPVTGGFIIHKTGPGHSDFSEPFRIEYKPSDPARVKWDRPVALLTNRSCFSAANDFTSVMKSLPSVKVIGAKTGGGGGLPFSSEIPVGWSVRFSACPLLSPEGVCTENGIDPSEGFEVHSPAGELAEGNDAILNSAITYLMTFPDREKPKKTESRI